MNQKSFALVVIILIVIGFLVVGGGVYFYQQQKKAKIPQNELPQQKTEIPITTTTETEKQVENLQFVFPKGGEILNTGKEYKVIFTPFNLDSGENEVARWWLENITKGVFVGLSEGYIVTVSGEIFQDEIIDSDYGKGVAVLKLTPDDMGIGNFSYGDEYRLILKKVKILEVGCDPTGCPEDMESLGQSKSFRLTYSQSSDRVSDFTAKVFGNKVFLSWSFIPPGENAIIGHGAEITFSSSANLYRSTSAYVIPDQSNLITTLNEETFDYTDKNLSSGIYYYKLVAKDWNMGTVPSAEVQAIIK